MNKISIIILGLSIIVLGILVGLNVLEILNFSSFFRGWWTLFIIVPSLSFIITSKDKALSIIFFSIGLLLLLACINIIDFTVVWNLLLPILIIGVGFSFIFKFLKSNDTIKKNEIGIVFEKITIKIDKKYHGGIINTIFGSFIYDLSDSDIGSDIMLDVTSLFGKTTIILPKNVNVLVKSSSVFGSVINKRKTNKKGNDNTVFISSKSIFGGVIIK
jgi:predicted membrane protein